MMMHELVHRLARAIHHHRAETGIDMNGDNFELRIHPMDWDDFLINMRDIYFVIGGEARLLDLPVRVDQFVAVGHPEVISTWRYVL